MKNRRQWFANPAPKNRRRQRKTNQKSLRIESLEIRRLLYGEPIGGWDYIYQGDAAADGGNFTSLDGTWDHDNGSDQWDGTAPGAGRPGGSGTYVDAADGATFLRIQDTGDPRDYGFADPGSNRKVLFGHNIGSDGAASNVIDTGVTLTFRTRLSTAPNVDDAHPNSGIQHYHGRPKVTGMI